MKTLSAKTLTPPQEPSRNRPAQSSPNRFGNGHWVLLLISFFLLIMTGCAASTTSSSRPTVFSPSEDITVTVGAANMKVTIEVTTNDPPANPLITISGLVNPLGASTVITLTTAPIEGIFTTTTRSLTIPNPAGATETTTTSLEPLQITNTETGAEITYDISVVFTSLPAEDVLKTSNINDYLMVMLAEETGVSEVAGSVITVRGLFNPRGSTAQSGVLTLMNDVLQTEGYIVQLSSPTFTDPEGAAAAPSVSVGTLTLAEGTDVTTPVAGNVATYTIEVMLAEYISALVRADITATFNGVTADPAAITLTGQDVTITGFTNELDSSTALEGSVMIADETIPAVYTIVPSKFTFTDPTGIGAATTSGMFTLTEDSQDIPYTITINFLPSIIQVSLTNAGLANAVMLELGAASVGLTVMRCELFVPTLAVTVGEETRTDYVAMFTSDIPSSYYDDTTAANNTNAVTITVQDGSGTAVGTAAATLTIQACVLIDQGNIVGMTGVTGNLTAIGTASNPWNIDNDLRLNLVSTLVNNSADRQYADDYYEMTKDIDLGSAEAPWSKEGGLLQTPPNTKGFTPIGTTKNPSATGAANHINRFTGNFNCAGKVISNLYINNIASSGMNNGFYEGLFGIVDGGTVRNCGLVNAEVTGRAFVGGLIGIMLSGAVSNSYAEGGTINAIGVVNATTHVGGLVGQNNGTVANSYASVNVINTDALIAGGLVGRNLGTITGSYAAGSVTGSSQMGGLVGNNRGGITNSYVTGSVTGTAQLGGLVGNNQGAATIINSYATGSVTGTGEQIGGLVGNNQEAAAIINSYATGSITGSQFLGGLVGSGGGTVTASYWDKGTTGRDTSDGSPDSDGKTTAELQVAAPSTTVYIGWELTDIWNFTAGQYPRLINVACALCE